MKKLILLSLVLTALSIQGVRSQEIIACGGYLSQPEDVENTIASLKAAQQAGIYGVECDVNMTLDDELVVLRGLWLGKRNDPDRLNIQRSDLVTLRSKRLANGDVVPTLEEYLQQLASNDATRLVINVVDHATPQAESEVVRKIVALVKQYKLQERVDYAASRQHICSEFKRLAPAGSKVFYMGNNLTPKYVAGLGYTGICYTIDVFKRFTRWIDEAKRLGLSVGIRVVNTTDDALWAATQGVDYITTEKPTTIL